MSPVNHCSLCSVVPVWTPLPVGFLSSQPTSDNTNIFNLKNFTSKLKWSFQSKKGGLCFYYAHMSVPMLLSWFLVNPCILVNPCTTKNSDCTTSCDTIFQYALNNFILDEIQQKIWREVGLAQNLTRKCKLFKFYTCLFSPAPVWWSDMSWKCEMHNWNFFHSSMNLKIYSDFDLNHLVAYFPFRNVYTFSMHGLTR